MTKKFLLLILFIFSGGILLININKNPQKYQVKATGSEITVNIDPTIVKHENFIRLLGGFLPERTGWSPSEGTEINYSNPNLINVAKQVLPFPNDSNFLPIMRTRSGITYENDIYGMTDENIVGIINFCKEINCDPMFSPLAVDAEGKMDFSNTEKNYTRIRDRVKFIKNQCTEAYKDTAFPNRCRNWDFLSEPNTASNCYVIARYLRRAGTIVKEEIPDSIFHMLELVNPTATIRGTTEPVGECIVKELDRQLQEAGLTWKIDFLKTHWYPYFCDDYGHPDGDDNVDGNKLLAWNGYHNIIWESIRYPYQAIIDFRKWSDKYNVSKDAKIGLGEIGTTASCALEDDSTTKDNHGTWGAAFWYLDVLGTMAEAGIDNVQKHKFLGGSEEFDLISLRVSPHKTPPAWAYQFLSQYFGSKIVQSQSSNPAVLNVHASLDKNNDLRIILLNKSGSSGNGPAEEKQVTINLGGFNSQPEGKAYVLKIPTDSQNRSDFNSREYVNVNIQEQPVSLGNTFVYTVPVYSAVILKIPRACNCPIGKPAKNKGNANCDEYINNVDLDFWRKEKKGELSTTTADFNCDGKVDIYDLMLWRENHY